MNLLLLLNTKNLGFYIEFRVLGKRTHLLQALLVEIQLRPLAPSLDERQKIKFYTLFLDNFCVFIVMVR